jgi:hypothetical protein
MILSFKLGLICSISMRHSEDGFDIHPVPLEKLIWSNSRNIHRTSHIFQLSLCSKDFAELLRFKMIVLLESQYLIR